MHVRAHLFLQRASAAGADLGQDAATRSLLSTLCNDLGGLPLAIELAAAQLYTMELDLIVREIGRRIGVLSGQRRSSDRHRSLAAAMQWSYDLLTEDERRSFANLAVFRAAFDADAAAATMGCEVDEGARPPAVAGRAVAAPAHREALVDARATASVRGRGVGRRSGARSGAGRGTAGITSLARSSSAMSWRAAIRVRRCVPSTGCCRSFVLLTPTSSSSRTSRDWCVSRSAVETYGMCRPRNEVMTWGLQVAELDPLHPSAGEMLAFAAYRLGDAPAGNSSVSWRRRPSTAAVATTERPLRSSPA